MRRDTKTNVPATSGQRIAHAACGPPITRGQRRPACCMRSYEKLLKRNVSNSRERSCALGVALEGGVSGELCGSGSTAPMRRAHGRARHLCAIGRSSACV